jgi:hypothetical protein
LTKLAISSIMRGMTRNDLLKEIDRYLATHEISAREFSRQATGDSGLVSRLRADKANVTWRTIERIKDYMSQHRIAAE